jgi:hypothetical protein
MTEPRFKTLRATGAGIATAPLKATETGGEK